jgi:hypothetical protein
MEGGPVSGKGEAATRWATQVIVSFDHGLFRHVGVRQWGSFVGELARRGLVPIAWSKGERPPPIGIELEFRGLRATHCRLDGIDLTFCDLSGADFEGSSLKGAKVGDCPGANLRRTRLQGAEFRGDVSGADFTGAAVDGAGFGDAHHYEGEPPVGLPPETAAAIETVPREAGGGRDAPFMQPLRARVTIHEVPWSNDAEE